MYNPENNYIINAKIESQYYTSFNQKNINVDPPGATNQKDASIDALVIANQKDISIDLPVAANQENTSANPLVVANQENVSANPLVVVNQENTSVNPLVVANQENISVNPLVAVNQENTSANPLVVANQENTSANPPVVVNQENTSANPLVVVNQENISVNPPVVVNQESIGIDPPVGENKEDSQSTAQDIPNQDKENENGIILHISDLHFTNSTDEQSELYLLTQDLQNIYFDNPDDKLKSLSDINYIIISGDLVEGGGQEKDYEKAYNFIIGLCDKCNIKGEDVSKRVIVVPGNHDVNLNTTMGAYKLQTDKPVYNKEKGDTGYYKSVENTFYLARKFEWYEKFANYGTEVYEKIYNSEPFPIEKKEQSKLIMGDSIWFKGYKAAFFMFNTAADIDQFEPETTFFDLERLVSFSEKVRKDEEKGDKFVRIGIGHHPINLTNGNWDDIKFANALHNEDFKIYLHGHMHRDISLSYTNPQNVNPHMLMIGAGTLSTQSGMWAGTLQRYNITRFQEASFGLELRITVNTRQREDIGTYWQPANIYYNKKENKMTNIWNSID